MPKRALKGYTKRTMLISRRAGARDPSATFQTLRQWQQRNTPSKRDTRKHIVQCKPVRSSALPKPLLEYPKQARYAQIHRTMQACAQQRATQAQYPKQARYAQTHRTIPAKGALERATQPPNPNTKLGTGSFLRALGR